jgi:imidazolonepropionase-like amidohydrolase
VLKLLGWRVKIGSIETGKEADIVFLSTPENHSFNEEGISSACFLRAGVFR